MFIYFVFNYRLEIKTLKCQHQLALKEPLSDELIQSGATTAKERVRKALAASSLTLAKERKFLFHLIKKYASKYTSQCQ